MKDNVYMGYRDQDESYGTCRVRVNDEVLPMSERARQKSPTGYEWGYSGSGPSALAHSILAFEYNVATADRYLHQLKEWFLSGQPREQLGRVWTLNSRDIAYWMAAHDYAIVDKQAE